LQKRNFFLKKTKREKFWKFSNLVSSWPGGGRGDGGGGSQTDVRGDCHPITTLQTFFEMKYGKETFEIFEVANQQLFWRMFVFKMLSIL